MNNNSELAINPTIKEMNNLDAVIVLGGGLGEYAIRPLARLALNLLGLLERKFDSINYKPEWYQQEHARLDDLPYSTVQAALQKNWQIIHDHSRQYKYNL